MRKLFGLAIAVAVAVLAGSPAEAKGQGKYSLGIRANVSTPPNPNAAYGEAMLWGEQTDVNGQPFWGVTAHGSLTLPNAPNPGQGASAYRVTVKSVYHEGADAYAVGFYGALMKEGYWTTAGEVWWSGTFLAAWSGATPAYNLPYGGTYKVTFSLQVTVPGMNWTEVATATGEFEW